MELKRIDLFCFQKQVAVNTRARSNSGEVSDLLYRTIVSYFPFHSFFLSLVFMVKFYVELQLTKSNKGNLCE